MNETVFSQPVEWVGQDNLGFVINAAFSEANAGLLTEWLLGLQAEVPEGLYIMPPEALHITVLDWVAPLFDYGGCDKRALYESVRDTYGEVFRGITDSMAPFDVTFSEIKVTPGTIILLGQDEGQFAALRKRFTDEVTLPEGAKEPPSIIHSSLARFVPPAIDLAPLVTYARTHPLRFTQSMSEYRLVETRREPMQDFTVLDRYTLRNSA